VNRCSGQNPVAMHILSDIETHKKRIFMKITKIKQLVKGLTHLILLGNI
jgi:hypothetical protein